MFSVFALLLCSSAIANHLGFPHEDFDQETPDHHHIPHHRFPEEFEIPKFPGSHSDDKSEPSRVIVQKQKQRGSKPCSKPEDDMLNHAHKGAGCSREYYFCLGGEQVNSTCGPNELFDEQFGDCVERSKADCRVQADVQQAPEFPCNGLTGNFADLNQACSDIFFICTHNKAHKMKCPEGLKYEPNTNQCDRPEFVVGCGGRNCFGQYDGLRFAYPTQPCNGAFVECLGNKLFIRQCPGGLVFNEGPGFCDHRENVAMCRQSVGR